jgi:ribose transport system substrate-binding protein
MPPRAGCWNLVCQLWIAGLLAVGVMGCGRSASTGDADKPAKTKVLVIGVSQCNQDEPWRVQMNEDLSRAAKAHPNLEVRFKDAQRDSQRQQADIEQFVQEGVNLLIVSPNESQSLTDAVEKVFAAGVPVIVLDRPVIGDKYTCFLRANDEKIGRAAGRWLAERLGGKGNIVELKGATKSAAAQDRHDGFRQALRDPGFRFVYEADVEWLEATARKEMESVLARFDKIDAVFAHNDAAAHGAYLAAKAAGRETQTVFVGIGALPGEGLEYVAQGTLDATLQNPTGGAEAIDAALRIFKGEQVPKHIELPTRIFTKENLVRGGEAVE